MREAVTSALDVLALLLLAAGVAGVLAPLLGWACLAVAGLVVGAGSAAAAKRGGGRA